MRKSQDKGAIQKKSADTLKKQGLGYAKLPESDDANKSVGEDKVVKKRHEIYDNTYYISHNKSRIIGTKYPSPYRNPNKRITFPSNLDLLQFLLRPCLFVDHSYFCSLQSIFV